MAIDKHFMYKRQVNNQIIDCNLIILISKMQTLLPNKLKMSLK